MQRTFSREYGFLLGCWAFFAVLGFVLAACGGLADGTVSRAVIDAALTACEAMVAAALGILAIRYAWKPYLAAYAAVLVWYLGQYCFLGMPQALRPMNSAPAWVVIGTALMGLVLLALGGMVQYLLAKGLVPARRVAAFLPGGVRPAVVYRCRIPLSGGLSRLAA